MKSEKNRGLSSDDDSASENSEDAKTNAQLIQGVIQTSSAVSPVVIPFESQRWVNISPKWLNEAPVWIKSAIVLSSMATVFSVVFLIVIVGLSANHVFSNPGSSQAASGFTGPVEESSKKETDRDFGALGDTFSSRPSISPFELSTFMPSLNPSSEWPTPQNVLSNLPSHHQSNGLSLNLTSISSGEPSTVPSPKPTISPSLIPSLILTTHPTYNPSNYVSEVPTTSPTSLPSEFPVYQPTRVPTSQIESPSSFPTSFPISFPTSFPSYHPTPPTVTTFFVTAKVPEEEKMAEFKQELSTMHDHEADFFVHLGDFNQDKTCNETSYATFSELLRNTSEIPVFVVPGDNEWNDCPEPRKAWRYWERWFFDFDKHWSPHNLAVSRQNNKEENFSFLYKRVLFIGVRIVGGAMVTDADHWETVMNSNIRWLRTQLQLYEGQFEMMIVFGHNNRSENQNRIFFVALGDLVDEIQITSLYFHESSDTFQVTKRNFGAPDLYMVRVQAGRLPFVKVTIDLRQETPFTFENTNNTFSP